MLIVTVAALVMAASLGWFACRLMQEEQRRSDARVALLTAALQDAGEDDEASARQSAVGFAPLPVSPPARLTTVQAAGLRAPEVVYLDDDSRPARWFRSESLPETEPIAPADLPATADVLRTAQSPASPTSEAVDTRPSGLFAEIPEARPADARGAIALGGVVLVGALALGYTWFGRPTPAAPPTTEPTRAAAAATVPAPGGVPLDLVSLSHEQRAGLIVVRGDVRNPVSGSDRAGLVARVALLDQAGAVLTTGLAPVATTRLRPGDATGFAVEVPSHKDVRRYRVTFTGADGGLVAHADKRGR